MKFNLKKLDMKVMIFGGVILICILALTFAIYFQIFGKNTKAPVNETKNEIEIPEETDFNGLFNNQVNLQGYDGINSTNKLEPTKDLVYTTFSLNEIYEGKYEINANIPLININNENAINIDREILSVFNQKISDIIDKSSRRKCTK